VPAPLLAAAEEICDACEEDVPELPELGMWMQDAAGVLPAAEAQVYLHSPSSEAKSLVSQHSQVTDALADDAEEVSDEDEEALGAQPCQQRRMSCRAGTGTYYRCHVGLPPKTLVIQSVGTHNHAGDSHVYDAVRIFTPKEEVVAKKYLRQTAPLTKKGLKNFLISYGIEESTLPKDDRIGRWLRNHRPPKAPHAPAQPRHEIVRRALQEWPTAMPEDISDLYLPSQLPYLMSGDRVCIPFTCKGMQATMRRYEDADVAMFIDEKMKCMAHGWGVVTASICVKDELRRTTLRRGVGGRVQARMYTSHALPVLQAVVHFEETGNLVHFFNLLKLQWAEACPARAPLEDVLVQLHKDFIASTEAARIHCFPGTRPVNDFFHLMEKKPKIDAKLRHLEQQGSNHVKRWMGWVLHALGATRHLPTVDIFSKVWGGFLRRLEQKGEMDLKMYLGPGGRAPYSILTTVQELREKYGVTAVHPSDEARLIFAPHWGGIGSIMPGTDCGDQPQEAFHRPWQGQLEVLGSQAAATEVLGTMQALFREWSERLAWSGQQPLSYKPPADDDRLLQGPLLKKLGRSTAFELFDAQKTQTVHVVLDASADLQIVAVARTAETRFDVEAASVGSRMMTMYGSPLEEALAAAGCSWT